MSAVRRVPFVEEKTGREKAGTGPPGLIAVVECMDQRTKPMWVFGYGSLMWDGWEQAFDGEKVEGAVLEGYRRAFNKKSIANWGTEARPCPTLGLEAEAGATCTGAAFRFSAERAGAVWAYLREREGPSFALEVHDVRLPDGTIVAAYVAVNDPSAASYIGDKSPEAIAAMIGDAHGERGACFEYLENIRAKLQALSIEDPAVEALWAAVQRREGNP